MLGILWQVSGSVGWANLAIAPHRTWRMGARALVYFIGLGSPGWGGVWILGL